MLSLLFMAKKRKKSLEETVELIQQGDTALNNELIESYKPFIAKTVSSVCKRYIHESDDEFSIGLIAFNEAIQKYSPDKGSSLISFSEVLIKRRVIDYIRKQSKFQNLSFNGVSKLEDDDTASSAIEDELSIEDYRKKTDEELRKEEIFQFTQILQEFGLTFSDLIEQSPKHADARKNAMTVAKILVENEELKSILFDKKKLPIKQLEGYVSLSRKTIERNRKYIIAISLILTGDYVFLKDYIKGVLET
ncbi:MULTISPECIES: RNA polymerase sigma factor SigI [Bacillaceae]|uniref:RNA polymerase sigma factor SigI n=2 Tax=Cytobacillus firmus TaxID=1399 RepID=A0AA46PTG7_CYTFI|nr:MULTISPECIES: RNA polymerase sigma factor SigI [Bacillaceae]KML36353.1 RNA polymerase sigma factor SigI [Cytobacillus firmus]MBG9443413.1 RNA polymerase sigma factor SigI [Cytobacillus firmus]MBG9450029.1 RNA polymerase sigma factor SigI [Cytobacillus firmus]MCC3645420.1 RNA polymerase sigma factor SigI [Cytobacillus oceanisediminis]MCS0651984.1 RNA polymerase sigma factor SigI [Cytobacillus firmus]